MGFYIIRIVKYVKIFKVILMYFFVCWVSEWLNNKNIFLYIFFYFVFDK